MTMTTSVAGERIIRTRPESGQGRKDRGLALYHDKRGAFERIDKECEVYAVPSCQRRGEYRVSLATGECSCPDHQRTGALCKHFFAAAHYRRWIKGVAKRMIAHLDCEEEVAS